MLSSLIIFDGGALFSFPDMAENILSLYNTFLLSLEFGVVN
jgi:hypothetical protein